jgi:hypothetical protein
MEDLNKTQIILLTLLVSFVTSIATGIITVSLLQEVPQNVTQTINRVVEKTIERVVPEEGGETVKEVTVVVKEEDLVIDAIDVNAKSIVRIKDSAVIEGVSPFYGIGFLVSDDGLVVSARRENVNMNNTYTGVFPNGTTFSMKVSKINETENLVFFQTQPSSEAIPAKAAKLAESDVKLGQTIISIEGEEKDIISVGRVTSFTSSSEGNAIRVNSDILAKTQVVGGPLINLSGEVVGIRLAAGEGTTESFLTLSLLKKALSAAE